jgi:Putative homoserine kinase type II (protein kinase fold)
VTKPEKLLEDAGINRVNSIEEIDEGRVHTTYAVETPDGELVLQVSPEADTNSLQNCLNIYKYLHDSPVPVPEVMTPEVSDFMDVAYTVVGSVPGTSVESEPSTHLAERSGVMLAKLHNQTSFDKPGWLAYDGQLQVLGFDDSYVEYIREETETAIKRIEDCGARSLASELAEFFDNSYQLIEGGELVLCHDDYSPDNILAQDGVVSGVIDFDYAHSGSARRDAAKAATYFDLHGTGLGPAFLRGYREVRDLPPRPQQDRFFRAQALTAVAGHLAQNDEFPGDELRPSVIRERIRDT